MINVVLLDSSHTNMTLFNKVFESIPDDVRQKFFQYDSLHFSNIDFEGRICLFALLKNILGSNFSWKSFYFSKFGKLHFSGENLFFNISHTRGMIALCIGDVDVGIDIEKLTKVDSAIRHSFGKVEEEYINTAYSVKEKDHHILKTWVAMESYLKFKGTGLLVDLSTFNVLCRQKIVVNVKDFDQISYLHFQEIQNYICCFCTEKPNPVYTIETRNINEVYEEYLTSN